jgi:POT family proton-dependent oligopeptide transporter
VSALHEQAARGEWFGYPRGAVLVVGVEFWERFSFYGMLSILALFLTAPTARGGFGWSTADALALVGAYSGAMYAFPAVGGFLADRVLGRRRAVALGASIMLVGQVMLASPLFLPLLLGWWHGAPLLEGLRSLDVPLGLLWGTPTIGAAIQAHGSVLDPAHGPVWLRESYAAAAIGFSLALLCLVVGNALMKSTLVVLCGETMPVTDPRREAAYAYYYLGIAIGAMLSGVVVGSVAEAAGWAAGFTVGAAGMAVSLGSYLLLGRRWLGAIGIRPDGLRGDTAAAGTRASAAARTEAWRRIVLIFILSMLLCGFSVGWFQIFGSWSLFIERHVDRTIGAFTIPVPWFASMNALVVIACAPAIAALWVRLANRRLQVDIVQKYAFALSAAALGHTLMYVAARSSAAPGGAPVVLPLLALALLGIGELVAWTATYGMVSRAAPVGFASVTMGAWYLMTLGLGGYLSGFSGRLVESLGFPATFAAMAILMGAAGAAALAARGPLSRLAARGGVTL